VVAAAMPAEPLDAIRAQIQGEISGQVAIGRHIVQVGSIHGALVTVLPPEHAPPIRPRPTPIFLRPHPFPGLLDRSDEVASAIGGLQSAQPVELHGEAGVGKTSLLRHLAFHPATALFRDGVIFLPARGLPAADVLQSLFDAFFDRVGNLKPTDGQLRLALSDRQALVVLDDVELARDDLQLAMDAAPGCTFLLASIERRLWGEGHAIGLAGIDADAALLLLERELGRTLTNDERPSARDLCAALQGLPLRLLQAAALAREGGRTLAEVCRDLRPDRPADTLARAALEPLTEGERRTLTAIASLGNASIGAEHLAAIVEIPDLDPILDVLARRHLIMAASPRFVAAVPVVATLPAPELAAWRARAAAYYAEWGEASAGTPAAVTDEAGVILELQASAVTAGRWRDVLRLSRIVDAALALAGRWGSWDRALGRSLVAARALGERGDEAWALHQLGSRALALGDTATAAVYLTGALQIREALGDRLGAAATRHNLGLLPAPPAAPREASGAAPAAVPAGGLATLLKLIAALILVAVIGTGGWYLASGVTTPAGLSAIAVSETEVALHWTDHANNQDGFTIERGGNGSPFAEIALVPPNSTDFLDTGLEPNTTYAYRVRAYRSWMPGLPVRQSGPSNEASATTGAPLSLEGLTVDPTTVDAGGSATGTVTLARAAPAGTSVRLSASHPDLAEIPDSVFVAGGDTSTSFSIAAGQAQESTEVTITATLGDTEQTATLTIQPPPPVQPALSGLRIAPATVIGGQTATGTVSLDRAAPDGGVQIRLTFDTPGAATGPADGVRVPAGETAATFPIATTPVDRSTSVVIAATLGSVGKSATLTVVPPSLIRFTCDPGSITAGDSAVCTVTLTGPAPSNGVVVHIGGATPTVAPLISVPAGVTVAAGDTEASFPLESSPRIGAPLQFVLTATLEDLRLTVALAVTPPPPAISGVSCDPNPASSQSSTTCTVTLDGAAPSAGLLVQLTTSDPEAAPVPRGVRIVAGSSTATFAVATGSAGQAEITATIVGSSATVTLEVVVAVY